MFLGFEDENVKILTNIDQAQRRYVIQVEKVKDEQHIEKLLLNDYIDQIRCYRTKYAYMLPSMQGAQNYFYRKDKKERKDKYAFDLLKQSLEEDFFGDKITIVDIVTIGYETCGYEFRVQYKNKLLELFIPNMDAITTENYRYAYSGKFALFAYSDVCSELLISSYKIEDIRKYLQDMFVEEIEQ